MMQQLFNREAVILGYETFMTIVDQNLSGHSVGVLISDEDGEGVQRGDVMAKLLESRKQMSEEDREAIKKSLTVPNAEN